MSPNSSTPCRSMPSTECINNHSSQVRSQQLFSVRLPCLPLFVCSKSPNAPAMISAVSPRILWGNRADDQRAYLVSNMPSAAPAVCIYDMGNRCAGKTNDQCQNGFFPVATSVDCRQYFTAKVFPIIFRIASGNRWCGTSRRHPAIPDLRSGGSHYPTDVIAGYAASLVGYLSAAPAQKVGLKNKGVSCMGDERGVARVVF